MKTKIIIVIALFLIIPNIVSAAWWNPISWFKREKPVPVVQVAEPAPAPVKENKKKEEVKTVPKEIVKTTPAPVTTPSKPKKIFPEDCSETGYSFTTGAKCREIDPQYTGTKASFFSNPTVENMRIFCASAKNIPGTRTKKILDSNKERMIEVNMTLYEETEICRMAEPKSGYVFLPLDNSLLIDLKSNDTEVVREAKVIYNDKVLTLINTSKIRFVGFKKVTATLPEEREGDKRKQVTYSFPTDLFQYEIDAFLAYFDRAEGKRINDSLMQMQEKNLMRFEGKLIEVDSYFE